MKEVGAVIFDWNGTLTSMDAERELSYKAVVEIFNHYNVPAPSAEAYFSNVTSDYMNAFYWPHGIPQTATRGDLNKIRTAYILSKWDPASILKPNAKDMVRVLYDRPNTVLGIVSGEHAPLLEKGLNDSDLWQYFQYIKSDAVSKVKWLADALEKIGVTARQAIYLDDSIEGIKSARSLDMWAVGISDGFANENDLIAAGADVVMPLSSVWTLVRNVKNLHF